MTVLIKEIPGVTLDTLALCAERLAFWINTYNALVADGVVALGLRHSVWELPDFFQRIGCRVGGLSFTADEIEHGVLRGNRPSPLSSAFPFPEGDPRRAWAIVPPDPRIHFALNCGARSCPPVRTYAAEGLDEQLDVATRTFVNREVTLEGPVLALPEIFKWFRADFDEYSGGLDGFLAAYLEEGVVLQALLARGLAGAVHRPWDWRLAAWTERA